MNLSARPGGERRRVAIISTHPIQYYAPWFQWLTKHSGLEVKVFYLWDCRFTPQHDPGFQRAVEWDIPLLEGYDYEFVRNTSRHPGSTGFFAVDNPGLPGRLRAFSPDAALLIGYKFKTLTRLIFKSRSERGFPLMIRGDSHRLGLRNSEKWKAETLKEKIRRMAITAVYRRFAACLYVGQANREYLRIHEVPEERLFFSPHAIDNDRFTAGREAVEATARDWRIELGIPPERMVILFAGKFEEKKRPLDLLAAFEGLRRHDVALLYVGSGEQEKELRSRAADMSNVFFAPFKNQSEMPQTYAACDLFVLPSFGSQETWGLAINEALCLSKPVIVSDHVGCAADLVRHGHNGLVFPAGDVDQLSRALTDALSNCERLRRWGAAGREIVSNYSYANATRGLEQAVASLLGHKSAGEDLECASCL